MRRNSSRIVKTHPTTVFLILTNISKLGGHSIVYMGILEANEKNNYAAHIYSLNLYAFFYTFFPT